MKRYLTLLFYLILATLAACNKKTTSMKTQATIAFQKAYDTLEVGQTLQLKVTYTPPSTSHEALIYKSAVDTFATVTSSGLVTALRPSVDVITATNKSNTMLAHMVITIIPVPVTSFVLNIHKATISVGDTLHLSVAVKPDNANKTAYYTPYFDNGATVDNNGVVTGIHPGYQPIFASSAYGTMRDTCYVRVQPK